MAASNTFGSYRQFGVNSQDPRDTAQVKRRNVRAFQHPRRTGRPAPAQVDSGPNVRAFQHPTATPAPTYSTAAPQDQPQPQPQLADYAKQYQDSLARSRAAIETQFRTAFDDIGKREGLGHQAVGLLPGELTGIYDRSKASIGQQTGALDAAQKASGLSSYMTADAQMAPLNAASASDQATRQADVPLLQIATTAAGDQQRGALGQARLGAEADLAGEERGYFSDLAKQQEAARIDAAAQKDTFARDQEGKKDLARFDFGLQQAGAGLEARQARNEEGRASNNFGSQDVSAARGQWLRDYQPGRYHDAQSSHSYRHEDRRVRHEQDGENDMNDIAGAIKRLRAKGLYRQAAIFSQRHMAGRIK